MTNPAPIEIEQLFRFWRALPYQQAAISELQQELKAPGATYALVMRRDRPWFATWSQAGLQQDASTQNLQSWLTYFTSAQVEQESRGKIRPLTPAEACGFIGCIIIETGKPNLDRLDVIEAGSGAGRGAMQYTGVRRIAYDKARSAALARGVDPNGNRWQQQYFAEEYAGLHDSSQGSLIGWTRIFENRPAGMTPAQAAEYWTGSAATRTGYFRPGVPHLDRRQREAQRVWGLVQSGALKPVAPPPLQQGGRGNPLQVPWYAQLDSATDQARRMCFSTSCAMLLQYLKPGTLSGPNGDDQYLRRVQTFGDTTEAAAQIKALASYGIKARFIKTANFTTLEQQIAKGVPVPCGYLHQGPLTKPAGGGHWLIVVGHTSTQVIVHDPIGEVNLITGGMTNKPARFASYSRKDFGRRWMAEGANTGWAIIAER